MSDESQRPSPWPLFDPIESSSPEEPFEGGSFSETSSTSNERSNTHQYEVGTTFSFPPLTTNIHNLDIAIEDRKRKARRNKHGGIIEGATKHNVFFPYFPGGSVTAAAVVLDLHGVPTSPTSEVKTVFQIILEDKPEYTITYSLIGPESGMDASLEIKTEGKRLVLGRIPCTKDRPTYWNVSQSMGVTDDKEFTAMLNMVNRTIEVMV